MHILFTHRNFPGQFRNLAFELAKDPLNLITFITGDPRLQVRGINKLVYPRLLAVPKDRHPFLDSCESDINNGQAAANLAYAMKKRGIIPDIIYGHSWGTTMFMKDIFPDVPLVSYFEWFANTEGADLGFDGRILTDAERAKIRVCNSTALIDLYSCDAGVSPTHWQKSQFPKEFQDKINVIHDGVNTDICKPDDNAIYKIPDTDIELTVKDEVVTYATRGMEPYRGFPEFMEAVAILQKKRPNTHFVIGGEDEVYYGVKLEKGTFKEQVLSKLDLDMSRVHFVGALAFGDYIKLLQISSAHIYSTVPFILSWSCLDAMATGCCIIASNTQPVTEFIQDNYNGLLFDFYDIDMQVEKIEYALDNQDKMKEIRQNAVQTIVENYSLKDLLPKQIDFLKSLIRK